MTLQTNHRKHTFRSLITLVIVFSLFVVPVFAANDTSNILESIQKNLNNFISLLSWLRVVFAILAGKLMTNDWVYGSVLHLDVYLWKIRNIMKNFANFALVGILLGSIIKSLVGKGDLKIKKLLTQTLVAGVLIQASWFLMWALLDISTVAVSAVGSFPQSFIGSDTAIHSQLTQEIQSKIKWYTYKIDLTSTRWGDKAITQIADTSTPTITDDDALQALLPNETSISWPLVYLGVSAFRFQEYMNMNTTNVKNLAVWFSLKALSLIFYTLWLALLFIANLMRIAFLRVYIIGAPFIILIKVFNDDKTWAKWLAKSFNFNAAINMIFKPVLFVAALSVSLIFIVSIQKIMSGTELGDINGVSISTDGSKAHLWVEWISSITIDDASNGKDRLFWDISSTTDSAKNIFKDMIIFFLCIFLVWNLIKMSLTSGGDGPLESVMKSATWWIEWLAKTTPILPMMGWASLSAFAAARDQQKTQILKWLGMDTRGQFATNENDFKSRINTLMGMQAPLADADFKTLNKIITTGWSVQEFFDQVQSLAQSREWGMSLSDPRLETAINTLFTTYTSVNNYKDLKTLLNSSSKNSNGKTNATVLHNLLGGQEGTRKQWSEFPSSYDELRQKRYYNRK